MSFPVYKRVSRVFGAVVAARLPRIPVLAAIATGIFAVPLAVPGPAAALPQLYHTWADSTSAPDFPYKWAHAWCTYGDDVISGGGEVIDGNRVPAMLTGLHLVRADTYNPARFSVSASAVNGSSAHSWTLRAYATCARAGSLEEYTVRSGYTDYPTARSGTWKVATGLCPDGTVAYGSGGSVVAEHGGKVFLQLNRTAGDNDLSRATGRAQPGYNGKWGVRSDVACAKPQGGIHFDGAIGPVEASDRCAAGFRTYGIGGGGSPTQDGGPVWLNKIAPHPDHRGVEASMTGPMYPHLGGMVAHQRCGQ